MISNLKPVIQKECSICGTRLKDNNNYIEVTYTKSDFADGYYKESGCVCKRCMKRFEKAMRLR